MTRFCFAVCIVLGLAACHPGEPEPLYEAIVSNGMEEQGRYLLGEQMDGWVGFDSADHFSVSTQAIAEDGQTVTLSIAQGAALRTTPFKPIRNVIVSGGSASQPVTLRITEVPRSPVDSTITQLLVEKKREDGSWDPIPCGDKLAVPMAGVFTRTGLHKLSPGRLTLSCLREGVVAKCAEWSFRPGTDPNSLLWKTHQACTRMARADICSVGRTHTRNNTLIWFFDTIPGNDIPDAVDSQILEPLTTWPPPPSVYYFEAMWRAGEDHAGCLSKLRWQEQGLGALCNGRLPDPRSSGGNGLAGYCEGTSIEEAIDVRGALLFNKTKYNDLGLALWVADRPDGSSDFTTTVRGFPGGPADPTIRPFHERPNAPPYFWVRHEAFLMRVPPSNLTPQQYAAVATFVHTTSGDRVLARKDDPLFGAGSGYALDFDEGYVTNERIPGSNTPLFLWRSSQTGDQVATTGENIPPGYVKLRLIGYVADPLPSAQ